MIKIYYSSIIDQIRQTCINSYITSLSGLEFRKDTVGMIILPHPTISIDTKIDGLVTLQAESFINIEINDVIRFRGRISKIHKYQTREVYEVEVDDLLKRLGDYELRTLHRRYGESDLENYFDSLPHNGIYDFRYFTGYTEWQYISVKFLLKILIAQGGISVSDVNFTLTGESPFIEHHSGGGYAAYDELALSIPLLKKIKQNNWVADGIMCLELLQLLLMSINAGIEYADDVINIIPVSLPGTPSQFLLLSNDYKEGDKRDSVEVETSDLAAGSPTAWESGDLEKTSYFYPEETENQHKIKLPSFYRLGLIEGYRYNELYDASLLYDYFGEQLAEFIYNRISARDVTWIEEYDQASFIPGFWFDILTIYPNNYKIKIEYGGIL